jgi:hypothetical protein
VLASLITYGQWLRANPNPSLASTITVPGCGSANDLTTAITAMVADRQYLQPTKPVLTSVVGPSAGTVTSAVEEVTVAVRATRNSEARMAYTSGAATVLASEAALPSTFFRVGLIRGTDSRWRFCSVVDVIHDPDGEAIGRLL